MGNHLLFVGNVSAHLVALMSGIASFVLATVQAVKKHPLSEKLFWAAGAFCLFAAFDQAWQDEHRNTQVVAGERALESGARNVCEQDARIQQAYAKGLEANSFSERRTIDSMRQTFDKQQLAVNGCVVSLGKMNPVLTNRVEAYYIELGKKGNADVFEMLITTNHPERPSGRLRCGGAFDPMEAPALHVFGSGTITMLAFQSPFKINDRAYDLRIVNTAGIWGPNTPIYFKFTTSDAAHLGECGFTPE